MPQPGFVQLFAPEQRLAKVSRLGSCHEETDRMMPSAIDPDMSVDEIMRRWPKTIRVMIRHRMLCIGCPIGIFHTVADAAAAHAIDGASFSAELLAAMRSEPSTAIPSALGAMVPEPRNHEGEASCA